MAQIHDTIDQYLNGQSSAFLSDWMEEALGTGAAGRPGTQASTEEAKLIAQRLHQAIRAGGDPAQVQTAQSWAPLRDAMADLSASRAARGTTAEETSTFVLAMKRPLFAALQAANATDPKALADGMWWASTLVDKLAAFTVATYQRTREDIIKRQQLELLELSTPVIKLWEGVLAVPMIGTLDSSRTQLVMEALLQRIVETGSELAIIDITGVPTVDTLVAQHLLKTVTAIRLMGADCIISGIRPQIAQTIVHLGIDLQGVTTKATLADALSLALKRNGYSITRNRN